MTRFIVVERHADPYQLRDEHQMSDASRGLPLFRTEESAKDWLDAQMCAGLLPRIPDGWGYGPATHDGKDWFATGPVDENAGDWEDLIRYEIVRVEC